jgi:hypothetical protein
VIYIISISARSQPVINATDFNPFLGLAVKYYTFNPFPFDPGPSGANVTWDFSAVAYEDSFNTNFIDPATTAHAVNFPNANIAGQIVGTGFEYFDANSSFLSREGLDMTSQLMPYSDGEKIITYPCSYTTTFTDHYASTFTAGGFQFYRNGDVYGEADAYGTLMLPWGSVQNVLRLHLREIYTDSTGFTLSHDTADQYQYITPGIHFPLCSILKQGNTIEGSYLDEMSVVGINSLATDNQVKVYPNPASDHLFFSQNTNAILNYTITDITGKVILQPDKIVNRRIDIQSLSPGYYFLNINTGTNIYSYRFVKQ